MTPCDQNKKKIQKVDFSQDGKYKQIANEKKKNPGLLVRFGTYFSCYQLESCLISVKIWDCMIISTGQNDSFSSALCNFKKQKFKKVLENNMIKIILL